MDRFNSAVVPLLALALALRTRYGFKTDRPMVSKWESGYQVPEMYTIKCIAELCDVSTDYLCGKEKPTPVSESGPSDPLIARLNELLRQANPDTKKAMIALLEQLQTKE